jgi:hypothetical protein
MSKMDNLRAMREARYEQAQARGARAAPTATSGRTVSGTPATAAAKATVTDEPGETAPREALCGHRNMGGRTCTREAGHAARSHRYS